MSSAKHGAAEFRIPFFAKGRVVVGEEDERALADGRVVVRSPALELDDVVYRRQEKPPAAEVPMAEIVELLSATGDALAQDRDGHLARALDYAAATGTMAMPELERLYSQVSRFFDPDGLWAEIDLALGGRYDGWCDVKGCDRPYAVRAASARIVHILAGNGPAPSVLSIVRGALARGVHLLKLPATDLMAATAVLTTMADVAPGHPVVRSFSAVYWRGGDASVESVLLRPEFFDKVAVWGGGGGLESIKKYIGPGLELIAMDPKVSISLVGREAFVDDAALRDAAEAGARDVASQALCHNSRYQYVEGTAEQVDAYCAELGRALVAQAAAVGMARVPADVRSEIEVLRHLEPDYRVWGGDGTGGVVVRSPEPVEFHPSGRTVNVIPVVDLGDALRFVGPATQVVGVHPESRKAHLRDALAAAGVQRVTTLGEGFGSSLGLPHDAMLVLNRMVRWAVASL